MEHEDNISKVRSRTLTKKLGNSNEEYITLNEINDLIFSLNLHNIITKDEASRIFKTIDVENNGKVKKLLFLNKLEESNKEDNCYLLFQELTRNFSSKCEKIIQKLKQIKTLELLKNQKDVLSDLDWIIDSITNEDIYEPELYTSDSLNKSVVKDFMGQITTVESLQLKKKDLEKISQSQDIHKTKSFLTIKKQRATVYRDEISKFNLTNLNNENSEKIGNNDKSENQKKNYKHHKFLSYDNKNKNSMLDDENLEKIKEVIDSVRNTNIESNDNNEEDENGHKDRSNSIFDEDDLFSSLCLKNKSQINDCLKYIDDFSFDIFALEEYTGKSLLKVMSLEIFNQKNYLQTIVSKNTFLNFIDEVINGYTRNITYHNDIHAADVFQTVFVMFSVGDIEEVSYLLLRN